MTKRKGHFEGQFDFLSSLPLAVCADRLWSLQDDDHQLTMKHINSDTITFTMQLRERGIIRAQAQGTLRRWEGTLTRVDCDVQVREGLLRWLFWFGAMFLLTMIALPIMLFLIAAVDVIIWVGISLLFVAILGGLMLLVNHYAPLDDTPANLRRLIIKTLQ